MGDEQLEAVAQLWEDHLRAAFPAGLRGGDDGEIDLATVDADIAGCVSTWLENFGRLDATKQKVIKLRIVDLEKVRTVLKDEREIAYCDRLRAMAVAISRR